MGIKRSPAPYEFDGDYLHEWSQYGLNFDKLKSMDSDGETKKQEYLMGSVPHVTRMLRSGFKPDDFSSLQTDIPLPMYSEAWEHNIHPTVLNKAYFVGSLKPEDLQSKPTNLQKNIKQQHRIFPTVDEGAGAGYKNIIPGNMGHFISSIISGASPEEATEAHRLLLPYATSKNYLFGEGKEGEERFAAPLDEYAKFRKNGGTHEEFKQLHSAIVASHSRKGVKQSSTEGRNSLKSILSNYSDYRGMGLNHQEAGKAVAKFSEGTSPLTVKGDDTFRKAIGNGATSNEYWDASDKKMDMNQYAQDRKTKNHKESLRRGTFDISSLF
jgi:hypothetical protein